MVFSSPHSFTLERSSFSDLLERTNDQHIDRFKKHLDPIGKSSFERIPKEYQRRLVAMDRLTPQQQLKLMRSIIQTQILLLIHALADDMTVLMLLTRRRQYHQFFLNMADEKEKTSKPSFFKPL